MDYRMKQKNINFQEINEDKVTREKNWKRMRIEKVTTRRTREEQLTERTNIPTF